jgi:acyl-CoA synthetase (AMP-forming)/AMP-acid ligase II
VIGLPLPGIDLKLIPNSGKLEMRVRGPNVFPGYRHNESATRDVSTKRADLPPSAVPIIRRESRVKGTAD